MDLLNETVLLKTKSTLFKLSIRETSQLLCYERLLNMTYVAYKNAFFRLMQFWSHCYTVVSYQALFRLSVYKIPAVYLSGAKNLCFCTICNFGSPTINKVKKRPETGHTMSLVADPESRLTIMKLYWPKITKFWNFHFALWDKRHIQQKWIYTLYILV